MNIRISQFLNAENITQAQFADTIGVARASISHIIAGRNKPSYDFITSVLKHYPRLNPYWLMLGKGRKLTWTPPFFRKKTILRQICSFHWKLPQRRK